MIEANPSVQQLAEEAQAEFQRRLGRDSTLGHGGPRPCQSDRGAYRLQRRIRAADGDRAVCCARGRLTPASAGTGGAGRYSLRSMTSGKTQSWPADGAPPGGKGHWTSYIWDVWICASSAPLKTGPLDIVVHSTGPSVADYPAVQRWKLRRLRWSKQSLGRAWIRWRRAVVPTGRTQIRRRALRDHGPVQQRDGSRNWLILLDCRSAQAELVPLAGDDVSVLITNTNVKHALTGGEYAERRGQCEAAAKCLGVRSLRDLQRRAVGGSASDARANPIAACRGVRGEIERTTRAAHTIRRGDWPATGQLMYASHQSLKDDYAVSCDELDLLVDLARQIGVPGGMYGSRMTGRVRRLHGELGSIRSGGNHRPESVCRLSRHNRHSAYDVPVAPGGRCLHLSTKLNQMVQLAVAARVQWMVARPGCAG